MTRGSRASSQKQGLEWFFSTHGKPYAALPYLPDAPSCAQAMLCSGSP